MLWIVVADLDEALVRARERGGAVLEPPEPDGPSRLLATVADPSGNRLGLVSHS